MYRRANGLGIFVKSYLKNLRTFISSIIFWVDFLDSQQTVICEFSLSDWWSTNNDNSENLFEKISWKILLLA